MNIIKYLVRIILILGALQLGIMGAFNFDVIGCIFGTALVPSETMMIPMGAKVFYVVVGVAGLLSLISLCSCCGSGCDSHHKKGGHGGGGCCR